MGHISTTPTLRHVQKHYTGAHDMECRPYTLLLYQGTRYVVTIRFYGYMDTNTIDKGKRDGAITTFY